MGRVSMTVSFTHSCTNPRSERPAPRTSLRVLLCALPRWRLALACLMALWLLLQAGAVAAREAPGEVTDLQLEHTPQGLFLSASLELELPDPVETALRKGITVHFVTEAEVVRQRWYWSDKTVARATRYMRLSYQPLTRRWRLAQSPTAFAATGLGVSLGQNFDDLSSALAVMQRIARWKIAEGGEVEEGAPYLVQFQLRLDMSQLPRPMQIGAVGRSGWNMVLSRSLRLPVEEAAP